MQKIKNKLLMFANNWHFPFLILTIFLLLLHVFVNFDFFGDDIYFLSMSRDKNIFEWLNFRYNIWTSRLIIEFVLFLIIGHSTLWKFLNVAVAVLGVFSVSKIFSARKSANLNWVVCFLCLSLPISLHYSAGWITTTVFYLWVLSLGLFSMIPIKKILSKEKINWYEYILYFCAMIYAINQEQMCIILLMVYFVFMCYIFYVDKKLNLFLLLSVLLNVLNLFFIFTCPGNASRKILETGTWFPDYVNISFFRKLEMGYSSTLFEFLMRPNRVFLIFSIFLFICVILKRKDIYFRFVGAIPLICSLIFGFFGSCVFGGVIKNAMTPYGTGIGINPVTWIPDIILLLVCVSVIISLYILFEDKKVSFLVIFILLLGFISRMIMAFSPTIWASGNRTFIFMYSSILICSFMLYQEIVKYGQKIFIKLSNFVVVFTPVLSVVKEILNLMVRR